MGNYFEINSIKISGISCAVPKNKVSVESYKEQFGISSVEKFIKHVGVKEFRKTEEFQTAADLGYEASRNLLEKKNIDAQEIDGIVFVSLSPDYRRPSSASVIHKRLGLKRECVAFDIGLGCSGFVYGIQVLASLMSCSNMQKGIVIVAESVSKLVNPNDKSCAMLLGDAGSAILLEKKSNAPLIRGSLYTDGRKFKSIIVPGGGFRNLCPSDDEIMCADGNRRTLNNICMNGVDVFSFAANEVPHSIRDFLDKTNTWVDSYDCFAIHQANLHIINQICKKAKIPMDKVPLSLPEYGNVSGPSIPLTLCYAYGNCDDKRTINVLSCGFGVGLSWGVLSTEISIDNIFEIIETDSKFEEGIINSFSNIV